jgi:hypothetical protein
MLKLENAIQAKDVKRDLLGMQDFNELLNEWNGNSDEPQVLFRSQLWCSSYLYTTLPCKVKYFFFFFPELLISHECCLSHFKYYIWPWKSLSKVA